MLANKQVDALEPGDHLVGQTGTLYRVIEVVKYGEQDVRPCVCELVTEPQLPNTAQFTRSDTLATTYERG